MAPDPQKIQSIFHDAVEHHAMAEWPAFLDQACGSDAALRQCVEALLRGHEQPNSLLDEPAPLPATGAEVTTAVPGAVIGPYKLLEPIGEGGMGKVWMAQQTEPVKRLVAVKLIKAGMDSKQVIARFEAERQALALMDHPNIARVLDAGATSAGRPYFVMDLVKGVPITRYCDEHHLTPRQRLELFIPICQAVQHAHQKGIIHRDLKPSNVLVALYDGKPVPKVIDFGVAKAAGQQLTDKTLVTGFGNIVGTLEYMSPEQAEINQLDIDTRSDIYSLGVMLYELLAGSTPFSRKGLEKAGMLEMLRVIREQEPSKPSTKLSTAEGLPTLAANRGTEPAKLTKLVRGDLDWIVMKALEKDRSRRYETANGFAMDVQRYLADEAVLACPPSAGYRLRKLARRNKATLVMVSVVTLAVLLVVGSLGWMVRDRTAREQEITRDRETRQAVIKERVMLALEEARKRHREGRWREALDAAKRAEALLATGERDEETHQRVREVLGDMQMLATLENVRVRSTQNEAGFDLKEEESINAQAFREYGIDIDMLDRDEAVKRIRPRSIRYELAVFLDSWSHVRRCLGESKATGNDWRELLEIARAVDPDPWRDRFRKAVLNDDRRALVELAASAPILALPAETVDRLGDALLREPTMKEAAAFLKKGQQVHPQDYWINRNLANCLMRLGQRDDAIRYYMVAVALRPEAVSSHLHLGDALAAQGNLDDAIACFRRCIELSPKWVPAQKSLAAALERRKGKPDEAALAYQEAVRLKVEGAVAVFREAVRRKPDDYMAHFELGDALGTHGKLDEAVKAYQVAFRLKPDLVGKEIVNKLVWHFRDCADAKGRDPKAAVELVRQVMAQNPNIGEDPNAARSGNLALILLLADDTDTYRWLCVDMIGKHGDTNDPPTAYLVARICALAPDAGPDAAVVVQIADRAVRAEPAPHYLHALGLAQYRAGKFDKAIEQLQKSSEGAWSANAANWLVLAMVHQRLGRFDEARKSYDMAVRWIDGSLEAPGDSLDALRFLHPHDALACLVLRREAESLLGLRPEPDGKKSTAKKK